MRPIQTISFAGIVHQIVYSVHQLQPVHHACQVSIRQQLVHTLYAFNQISVEMDIFQIV
jgi:hypothetical protein